MGSLVFSNHPCTLAVVFCDDAPPHHAAGYFWRAPGADWREISWPVYVLFRWLKIDGTYRHNEGAVAHA